MKSDKELKSASLQSRCRFLNSPNHEQICLLSVHVEVHELHHQFDKLDDKKIGISKKFSCTHDQENLNSKEFHKSEMNEHINLMANLTAHTYFLYCCWSLGHVTFWPMLSQIAQIRYICKTSLFPTQRRLSIVGGPSLYYVSKFLGFL